LSDRAAAPTAVSSSVVSGSSSCSHLLSSMLLAVLVELRLRVERGAEALESAEQRRDLVERVLTRFGCVKLEPERDLVRAVRDPQADSRLWRPAPPRTERRVFHEDAYVRATVKAGQVEPDLLVDSRTANTRVARRVRAQVGHRRRLLSCIARNHGRGVRDGRLY